MLEKPSSIRALRRDGREFPALLSHLAIKSRRREDLCQHIVIFIRDVTQPKQLEAALREGEDHKIVLNHIQDGYAEIDLNGHYLFVNDAYCRAFKRDRKDFANASYKDLADGKNAQVLRDVFHKVYLTGEPVRGFEFEYQPGQFAEMSISLRRNAKGQPTGFLTVSRDTTERRRADRELAKAKEAAESANLAKSEFLANMSHEIRTPMNGVIGMIGVLLDTELTSEQREYAELVSKSGEALLTVINDILDFSKIEAGKLEIESVPFDLGLVLEDAAEMMAPKAEETGIDLVIENPSALPRSFAGDAGRIRQIVNNLVGNALKFTSKGHVLIAVGCEQRDDKIARMRIAVTDTGIGVPQEKIKSLFDIVSQAETSTTRRYGGTGLGLAISKQLVDLMGGQIQVESEAGIGSTFWFTLPLPLVPESIAVALPSTDLNGLRVLIVDDNEVNRRVVHEQITSWGMRNGSFASGEDALQAVRIAQACNDPYQFVDCRSSDARDGWIDARPKHPSRSRHPQCCIYPVDVHRSTESRERIG